MVAANMVVGVASVNGRSRFTWFFRKRIVVLDKAFGRLASAGELSSHRLALGLAELMGDNLAVATMDTRERAADNDHQNPGHRLPLSTVGALSAIVTTSLTR
jgi:hypothetical protein